MPERTINTRFWSVSQNNSGGIFDHDAKAGIGYAVCVEATDAGDAERRFRTIVEGYGASYDCPCCGDRWSGYFYGDGTEEPQMYGEPVAGGWGIPSYVHYIDGRIEERGVLVSA